VSDNFILTYSSQPSSGVTNKSSIAKSYFSYLRASSKPFANSNYFMLPGCLNFFQGKDGKCEHNIKVAKPLMLEWEKSTAFGNKKNSDSMLPPIFGSQK